MSPLRDPLPQGAVADIQSRLIVFEREVCCERDASTAVFGVNT